MSYRSFTEYLDTKNHNGKGKMVEKPSTEEVPDFKGKPNPEGNEPCKCKNIKDNQVVETMTKFKEYLDGNGKMKKPTVALNVNFPKQDSPPSQSMPPAPGLGQGKPAPYTPKKGGKAGEKGFADQGCCPAYEPDTKNAPAPKESLPKSGGGGKQPQIEAVTEMSLAEMTSYINEQNYEPDGSFAPPMVTAYMPGKFMPDPVEAIDYVTHLAAVNPALMETMIRALKYKTSMGYIVSEMAKHPETFKELAALLESEDGLKYAGSLCRSMNDLYSNYMEQFESLNESALSPPLGADDEDDEELDDELEDDDEEGDEDLGDEEDEEGEDENDPFAGGEEGPVPPPKKKPKKRFGHNNMIDAMGGHGHMLDAMKGMCKRCGVM